MSFDCLDPQADEFAVRSCTVAKKMPPPGWPAPDPNSRTMTADDLSLLGISRHIDSWSIMA
jgi:hypothetical protein